MMKSRLIWSCVAVGALLLPLPAQGSPASSAKPAAKAAQDEPLTLQQRAYKKFQELKASMRRLKGELAETDADKAKRLERGLLLIQERRIHDSMRDIETLLSQESWDMGLEKMAAVQKDLAQLLGLLMDRDVDLQELLDEIKRLEDYKKRVESLIEKQADLKDESRRAEDLAAQLERIERAKESVKKLKAEQQALKAQTQKSGTGVQDVEPLAKRQAELSEDAERLEKDLEEIEDVEAELDAAKSSEAKPSEGKPSEGKPGESQPGAKASSKAGKAAESMQKSQNKLGLKQPESSLDDQEKAIEELSEVEKALEELENEARAKLLELPFDKLKNDQEKVFGETFELSKDMEKDAQGGEGEDGEGQGKPTPGQQNIEQALPKQKNAAGSLKEIKPGKAKQKQQDAQDQLEEAKKRLEDALAQLRQEMQEEVLRALEERFTEMLAKQKAITANTILTHKWRARVEAVTKKGTTPSSVKDRCHRLAEGEQNLRQMARDALQLIEAEGSGAVFPEIVTQLADDFELAAKLLDGFATDEDTTAHQKEIEKTLTQLLDALTRRIEQIEARGGAP